MQYLIYQIELFATTPLTIEPSTHSHHMLKLTVLLLQMMVRMLL